MQTEKNADSMLTCTRTAGELLLAGYIFQIAIYSNLRGAVSKYSPIILRLFIGHFSCI